MTTTVKKSTPKKKAPARKKALATVKSAPPAAPVSQEEQVSGALMKAIESGTLQPEQLDMVLSAQERILDRQAKQAFAADMAACQADMPKVFKGKFNQQTNSYYEDLGDLNATIAPVYTRHGFAVSFNSCATSQDDWIGMKAKVSHKLGWSEEHTFELPIDDRGIKGSVNKTQIHGVASTRSYMRRYLLREIFNLITSEDTDDDGNSAQPELLISDDQLTVLVDLISETKTNMEKFLKYCRVDELDHLPASKYEQAKRALESKLDVPQ